MYICISVNSNPYRLQVYHMTCLVHSSTMVLQGKDDLRQDAVMQQVFMLVNRLLRNDPATRKRRLAIRTYKVILYMHVALINHRHQEFVIYVRGKF